MVEVNLKYLDVRGFLVDKLLHDGTLVPKHVGVGN
jgi:hypothetical protein